MGSWHEFDRWIGVANQQITILDQGFGHLHDSLVSSIDLSQNITLAQSVVTQSLGLAIAQTENLFHKQANLENSLNRSLAISEQSLKLATRWVSSPSLSLFSGPSSMSLSSLGGISTQLLIWSLHLIWQIAYSMVSAFCFVFILFRTGMRKSMLRWSNRFCHIPSDEESAVTSRAKDFTNSTISGITQFPSRDRQMSIWTANLAPSLGDTRTPDARRSNFRRSASAPL
ncbi:hypothetical protein V866_007774 [Kwoniella sp. B9012]